MGLSILERQHSSGLRLPRCERCCGSYSGTDVVSDALDQAVSAMDTSFAARNMGDLSYAFGYLLGPVILTFGTVFRALEM